MGIGPNFVGIGPNFVGIGPNFVGIGPNFMGIGPNFVGIGPEFPNFVGIGPNFMGIGRRPKIRGNELRGHRPEICMHGPKIRANFVGMGLGQLVGPTCSLPHVKEWIEGGVGNIQAGSCMWHLWQFKSPKHSRTPPAHVPGTSGTSCPRVSRGTPEQPDF